MIKHDAVNHRYTEAGRSLHSLYQVLSLRSEVINHQTVCGACSGVQVRACLSSASLSVLIWTLNSPLLCRTCLCCCNTCCCYQQTGIASRVNKDLSLTPGLSVLKAAPLRVGCADVVGKRYRASLKSAGFGSGPKDTLCRK